MIASRHPQKAADSPVREGESAVSRGFQPLTTWAEQSVNKRNRCFAKFTPLGEVAGTERRTLVNAVKHTWQREQAAGAHPLRQAVLPSRTCKRAAAHECGLPNEWRDGRKLLIALEPDAQAA